MLLVPCFPCGSAGKESAKLLPLCLRMWVAFLLKGKEWSDAREREAVEEVRGSQVGVGGDVADGAGGDSDGGGGGIPAWTLEFLCTDLHVGHAA